MRAEKAQVAKLSDQKQPRFLLGLGVSYRMIEGTGLRPLFLSAIAMLMLFAPCVFGQNEKSQKMSPEVTAQFNALKNRLAQLEQQQLLLNGALAQSKKSEAEAQAKVKELTARLQALGMHEGTMEQRLLQSVTDNRVLDRQLTDLRLTAEASVMKFKQFIDVARVIDPKQKEDAKKAVDALQKALWVGFEKDKKLDRTGTIQSAKVISIDSQSGMLVLNVGEKGEAKVGMKFVLSRGEQELGEAIVTEVRKNISGLLVITKAHKDFTFRVGDSARVKLQR